ncbi:MAG: ABC transporter permease [Methanobrevibacter sp.]|nr:ABC transporter permease [Methanobrevibacter sp.]
MSFWKLMLKNPFRNKSRAFLAIIGIGIGIATIVALGAITTGLTEDVNGVLRAGGADFSISGNSSNDPTAMMGTEEINESWINTIKNVNGVNEVAGLYASPIDIPGLKFSPLMGLNSEDIKFSNIVITEGRVHDNSKNEVIIGKLASEDVNKSVNDTLLLKGKEYKIVGVSESGNPNIDWCVFAGLHNVQELVDSSENNNITMIYAKLDDGADVDEVRKEIEDKYGDNITVITSLSDIESLDNTMNMINGATLGISLLAIIIGGIGIINTMIMSVYERTREIGVLRAIGWKSRRILGMILGESLVLTIASGIVGSIIGILGIELMVYLNVFGEVGFYPAYSIETFVLAFSLAIVVGLIGGFYPAWRASRLPPTEALRYE